MGHFCPCESGSSPDPDLNTAFTTVLMKESKLYALGTVSFISSFENLNNETCASDPHLLNNADQGLRFVPNTDPKPGFE